MFAIVIASAAATWAINKLLNSLSKAAIEAVLKKEDLDEEAVKLKNALQRANLVLGAVPFVAAAGVKIEKTNLEEPIQEVQQLATELIKYLDELEYYDIKDKVKRNIPKKSWRNTITQVVGHSNKKTNKVNVARVRAIVEKLHTICDNVHEALDKFGLVIQANQKTSSRDTREEAQYLSNTKVFSRDNVKNKIIEVIRTQASSDQISIIPIVGDGGVGKTTLAQLVYNDPEVKAKFDIMIWVYVSANFDEVNISQRILENIPECGHKNTKSLAGLQADINKFLLNKRFLLVLDDMWEESQGRWDKLLAPIRATQVKGNVILVTSRSSSVARITTRTEAGQIILDGLDEQDFFPFFKRCIFDDDNKFQGQGMLLKIAGEIASKLNRNPLAAKSVGSLLRRKVNEEYWRRIRDSDEWRFQEREDDIIPALKLSYNHLPYHLQVLFSYCAIFPKGYKFDKEELVLTWIALGFVVHERKKLEDQASDCFDDLVDCCFFHRHEQYFVVHDLIHDVAQEVMIKKCLIIDNSDLREVFPSTCHLGIWNEQSIEGNGEFENKLDDVQDKGILKSLESLILLGVYDENFSAKLVNVFEKLHYVRVLRLQFNDDKLLSSIKKFIHLRYLELRYTSDQHKPLPEHICKLYHLQILDVRHWNGLNDLPKGMSNLVNLRYLLVPGSGSLHSKMSRVGDLEFLQELKEFRVKKENNGFDISELGNLKEIKGSLSILDLENITTKEEASRAGLKHKRYLRTLSLSWGSASRESPAIQQEIMEGLQPYKDLFHLTVVNYAGATPSWLAKNLSLTSLKGLRLQDCAAVSILPPFQDMPFLRTLSLVGLSSLHDFHIDFGCAGENRVSRSFAKNELELSEIEIQNCSALTSIRLHSCIALTKLSIKDCGALTNLIIKDCGALASVEVCHASSD